MAKESQAKYQDMLSQQDSELFERALATYEQQRLGPMRYTLSHVKRDSMTIINMVCFTRLPPWQWTEEHCSTWGLHLAEKNLNVATQRAYQSAIRRFLKFQSTNYSVAREIEALTGQPPQVSDEAQGGYKPRGYCHPTTTAQYVRSTEEILEKCLADATELKKMDLSRDDALKMLAEFRKHKEP